MNHRYHKIDNFFFLVCIGDSKWHRGFDSSPDVCVSDSNIYSSSAGASHPNVAQILYCNHILLISSMKWWRCPSVSLSCPMKLHPATKSRIHSKNAVIRNQIWAAYDSSFHIVHRKHMATAHTHTHTVDNFLSFSITFVHLNVVPLTKSLACWI